MIRIAIIKFCGLAAGGTEKYLQTLAANLPKDKFSVDYYYTNNAPLYGNSFIHPDNDPFRKYYLEQNGVKTKKITIKYRDDRPGMNHFWVDSDFKEVFNASDYDFVQTGRGGYKEYPFHCMEDSLFVDSIHSQGNEGVEDRDNILKTVCICQTQANNWVMNGGNKDKVVIIPPLVEMPKKQISSLRNLLGIEDDVFIYGMHQGNREDIYSPVPLAAYSMIENEKTAFVMLGGAEKYRQQARNLGLKNCHFLEFSSEPEDIHNFLGGIDVFAHGRMDGEVCSAAIIEALYHGLPIVSHPGFNNGHFEQIDGCGYIAGSVEEYASRLRELNGDIYIELSMAAKKKYNNYSLSSGIDKYVKLYENL